MNIFKKNKKQIMRVISLCLALTFLLSVAACGQNDEMADVISFSQEDAKDIYPSSVDKKLHVTDVSNLKEIAQSGLVTLLIDESTYSPVIFETLAQKYWYSLPLVPVEDVGGYDYSAAAATLTVVNGNETIYLNSQDNSVAFDNATYKMQTQQRGETKNIGVTVNYTLTIDEETARKNDYDKTDIAFSLSIEYKLEDGSLYVSCETNNLTGNQNAKIVNLGLLEALGASTTAQPGDFMLVPDGSGALIHTAVKQSDFKKMNFIVYGDDGLSASDDAWDEKPAVIAAYGIKIGDNAMAALIENGDAIASIRADRSTGDSGLNKVGANFNITQYKDVTNKKTISRYISQDSYTGDIKLCLRFLSGSNATYSGIAAVCREQLIRNKKLSTKTVETRDYLPFNLTTVGAIQKNIMKRIPIKITEKLTTFEQTQDMLSRLKSKGINGVSLRYKGVLSGGLNQKDISRAKVLRSLGGEKGFLELNDYMITQNMDLFLDINILSMSNKKIAFDSAHAKTILGDNKVTQTENKMHVYGGEDIFTQNLRSISSVDKVEKVVLKVLTTFRNTDIEGFCINDAGSLLYADFSKRTCNRQEAADIIAEQIKSLSIGRKTMMDTGNFYAIKNINTILNIPMSLEIPEEENPPYEMVPFVQFILHGIIDYSGAPINEAFNPDDKGDLKAEDLFFDSGKNEKQKKLKDAMLRCIEYGACPSYEWTYKELSKTESFETYYFDDWMNQAVDFHLKAKEALADLRGARMVKHSQIKPGVFCTEYEGNNLIYVNYTNNDTNVGSVTVKARNFLRIY